jgi:hypothetical protein
MDPDWNTDAMKSKLCMMLAIAAFSFHPVAVTAAPAPTAPKKVALVNLVINYDLAAGQASPAYTLPANKSVSVTGNCLTLDYRGVASATILQVTEANGSPSFLEWVGLESTSGSVITEGYSATQGTHILYLDYSHEVDIEVNSANSIVIRNSSGGQRRGTVTLTYSK